MGLADRAAPGNEKQAGQVAEAACEFADTAARYGYSAAADDARVAIGGLGSPGLSRSRSATRGAGVAVRTAGPDAVVRGVEELSIEDVEGLLGWLFSRLDAKAPGTLATAQFAEGRVREQLARRDAETVPGWSVLSDLAQDWHFLRQVARGIASGELPDDRTVIWKGTLDYIPRDTGVGGDGRFRDDAVGMRK
ncbi:hypothetical protein ACFQ8C_31805 [Streptomyces sp. NPDC056503]|uniref:hypothetical protein n=1 Tax=Streptomyces sp. NPDC056503 TaxID=3345842 RepID=UPI003698516D